MRDSTMTIEGAELDATLIEDGNDIVMCDTCSTAIPVDEAEEAAPGIAISRHSTFRF